MRVFLDLYVLYINDHHKTKTMLSKDKLKLYILYRIIAYSEHRFTQYRRFTMTQSLPFHQFLGVRVIQASGTCP